MVKYPISQRYFWTSSRACLQLGSRPTSTRLRQVEPLPCRPQVFDSLPKPPKGRRQPSSTTLPWPAKTATVGGVTGLLGSAAGSRCVLVPASRLLVILELVSCSEFLDRKMRVSTRGTEKLERKIWRKRKMNFLSFLISFCPVFYCWACAGIGFEENPFCHDAAVNNQIAHRRRSSAIPGVLSGRNPRAAKIGRCTSRTSSSHASTSAPETDSAVNPFSVGFAAT